MDIDYVEKHVLTFIKGDVEVFVQCQDVICIIDVINSCVVCSDSKIQPSDIAQAVADSFVTQFESALKTVISTTASKYINFMPTSLDFLSLGISLKVIS